jgi:uncharacterized protein (UPF0261 family)
MVHSLMQRLRMANLVLLGTCDTKLDEILYLRDEILRNKSVQVTLIDVGRREVQHNAIDIRTSELLEQYGNGQSTTDLPRNEVIRLMAECATKAVKELYAVGNMHGIAAAGGSGGTSLTASVMRDALPIGFPKLIVSTIASGDTGPIVGETDITLMYSVVDVAGLNGVLRNILGNAAAAISGMALSYTLRRESQPASLAKKRVGITMFGVTTPAVDTIRKHLESNYDIECYVFHATGHGGKAMERLVREEGLDAVLDLTTTEICDLHTGGNMSASPDRLEASLIRGLPNIISLGATDMSNFGPISTVPEKYKDRKLYEHNPVVTLMRSSKEECKQVGEFIVKKLKEYAKNPEMVEVWLPLGGVSMIATPGGPFEDADADEVLFQTVTNGLSSTEIRVVSDKRAINDPGFARDIAEALARKMGL